MGLIAWLCLTIMAFVIYHFIIRIWMKLKFYEAQGVVMAENAYKPFFGCILSIIPWYQKALSGEGDQTNVQVRFIREAASTNGIYDSSKTKAVMMTYFSSPVLAITDPAMVQEVFTTKNRLIDKNGVTQITFEELIGHSFVFAKGDEKWQKIRKACGHAFYKDRLNHMMLVLKKKLEMWIDKRNAEIEASSDKSTVVDIAKSFEKLFCRNIVHIILGEDISETYIEIENYDYKVGYETKKMCLPDAIRTVADQCVEACAFKTLIEGGQLFTKITGIKNVTKFQRTTAENA